MEMENMIKNTIKFYLAHPILRRYEVREKELEFEKSTGIQLINPFYDSYERRDIKRIDSGKIKEWDDKLDYEKIVEKDLDAIDNSDGIVACISKIYSIGTYMELWYGMNKNKPIYVVTRHCGTHPWIKYVVAKSNGVIVKSFEELEKFVKEKYKNV
jgi:nucleoside 2-deoxyribosyltransferase